MGHAHVRRARFALALCWALVALQPARAAEPAKDRWVDKEEVDKVTDRRMVYMVLMADDQVLNLSNWVHKNWPQLMIGCDDRRPVFAVGINKPPRVDGSGLVTVTTRYGRFDPVAEAWTSAQGGAYLRKLQDPINASVALTKVEKLLVRYAPQQGADVTLEFVLRGAADHMPRIARACGWNYEQALRRVH